MSNFVTGMLKHGETCKEKSDCLTMLVCVHDINGKLRCLCDRGKYFNDKEECLSTSYLTVTGVVHKLISPTRVELRWSSDSVNKKSSLFKVNYGNVTGFGNKSGITVNNLTPFTEYVFKITVTVPRDSYYDEMSGYPITYTIRTRKSQVRTNS
ncbi:hypothetical protein Btru_020386 [Bulinus truncatus]|nr:hypothetical protein Btru_020386 [Bulinus truncatus]